MSAGRVTGRMNASSAARDAAAMLALSTPLNSTTTPTTNIAAALSHSGPATRLPITMSRAPVIVRTP